MDNKSIYYSIRDDNVARTGEGDDSPHVPEIHEHELVLGPRIGGGTFGDVYRGSCRGGDVAIKKLKAQNLTDAQLGQFRNEIEILRYSVYRKLDLPDPASDFLS